MPFCAWYELAKLKEEQEAGYVLNYWCSTAFEGAYSVLVGHQCRFLVFIMSSSVHKIRFMLRRTKQVQKVLMYLWNSSEIWQYWLDRLPVVRNCIYATIFMYS